MAAASLGAKQPLEGFTGVWATEAGKQDSLQIWENRMELSDKLEGLTSASFVMTQLTSLKKIWIEV